MLPKINNVSYCNYIPLCSFFHELSPTCYCLYPLIGWWWMYSATENTGEEGISNTSEGDPPLSTGWWWQRYTEIQFVSQYPPNKYTRLIQFSVLLTGKFPWPPNISELLGARRLKLLSSLPARSSHWHWMFISKIITDHLTCVVPIPPHTDPDIEFNPFA